MVDSFPSEYTNTGKKRKPRLGAPQALTWNKGTTGMATSRADKLRLSGSAAAYEWRMVERCE